MKKEFWELAGHGNLGTTDTEIVLNMKIFHLPHPIKVADPLKQKYVLDLKIV